MGLDLYCKKDGSQIANQYYSPSMSYFHSKRCLGERQKINKNEFKDLRE